MAYMRQFVSITAGHQGLLTSRVECGHTNSDLLSTPMVVLYRPCKIGPTETRSPFNLPTVTNQVGFFSSEFWFYHTAVCMWCACISRVLILSYSSLYVVCLYQQSSDSIIQQSVCGVPVSAEFWFYHTAVCMRCACISRVLILPYSRLYAVCLYQQSSGSTIQPSACGVVQGMEGGGIQA